MAEPSSPLKQVATRETVEQLFAANLLSPKAYRAAIDIVDPPRQWEKWLKRLLLFLGCALVLSGTIFFFAYNWSAMGHFTKLGLIEALMLLSVILAVKADKDKLTGKVLLLAASVFVGVFLAVFGQTYQTGADAWQLFAGWSCLIFGWVVASRFAGLWLLWLILCNVAFVTYWHQAIDQHFESTIGTFTILLTLINGFMLFLRELGLAKGRAWLKNNYHRWIVMSFILIASTWPLLNLTEKRFQGDVMVWLAALLWLFVILAIYGYYRYKSPDLLALTMATSSVCFALLSHIASFFFSGRDNPFTYLIFGFIILFVVGPAAMWLKSLTKELKERQS